MYHVRSYVKTCQVASYLIANIYLPPFPLWKGSILLLQVRFLAVHPAITSNRASAKCVYHTQCLCVLAKLLNTWIVMGPTSLTLAAKKLFQWVLAEVLAQEYFHSINRK